jgi:hypothetical protein
VGDDVQSGILNADAAVAEKSEPTSETFARSRRRRSGRSCRGDRWRGGRQKSDRSAAGDGENLRGRLSRDQAIERASSDTPLCCGVAASRRTRGVLLKGVAKSSLGVRLMAIEYVVNRLPLHRIASAVTPTGAGRVRSDHASGARDPAHSRSGSICPRSRAVLRSGRESRRRCGEGSRYHACGRCVRRGETHRHPARSCSCGPSSRDVITSHHLPHPSPQVERRTAAAGRPCATTCRASRTSAVTPPLPSVLRRLNRKPRSRNSEPPRVCRMP